MRNIFPDLFGNGETKARLASNIERGTLSHAIMITGPVGSGRKTLARALVMALNCENKTNPARSLPCGVCNTCRRIREGNFPDFKTLSTQNGKATIGADDIRAMREDMFLSATEAEYKVYAVLRAECMTAAAQNALLKVLEEPPGRVHIILITTEANKLLTTIRSRTEAVGMELFPPEVMLPFVTSASEDAKDLLRRDKDRLNSLLITSGGVIGRALSSISGESAALAEGKRKATLGLISVFQANTPFSEIYGAINALPKGREELSLLLRDAISALRDIIVTANAPNAQTLFFLSKEEAEAAFGGISVGRAVSVYRIMMDALSDLESNVVISSLLTDIAVKIKEA